jgi:DNA-binding CsgD family transcriptional regulator
LALAIESGADDHASRIYANLGSSLCFRYLFPEADAVLVEGIAYCADRDLDFYRSYLLSWRAWSLKHQGQWRAASEIAQELLTHPTRSAISRVVALTVQGGIYTRQGDPRGGALLDEALAIALQTGEAQRLSPVRAVRAEAAWLRGDLDQVRAEIHADFDLIALTKGPWLISELAFWLWRANDLERRPEHIFEPFDLQILGNWKRAAAQWRELACPYEAAVALADSDDEAALRYAFAELSRLGAQPMMAMVTGKLRALGANAPPRGPRPTTQANPFQLTSREMEVLELIVQGRRTQDIGESLFLSPRTVGHHITAILAKLQVSSRHDAARKAVQLGIVNE